MLPGHTILVGDSSDEEFIEDDPFQCAGDAQLSHQQSTVINESLVEYSLIRKWLQNAPDSTSSSSEEDSSTEFTNAIEDALKKAKFSQVMPTIQTSGPQRNIFPGKESRTVDSVDDTIVLSSDDNTGASPILCTFVIHLNFYLSFIK